MDENIRSQPAEAHSSEATGANTLPASQAAQTNAPSSSTAQPSISKAAAWVENTELTLQPQLHSNTNTQTHTTSGVQPRAVQEMAGSPGKKQKQKQEHDGPDAKSQKYDRQLRLWGANGQAALENAHVCLVNNGCGTVGIETLKNIVLPGIGNFTIIDNKLVSEEDLGVNFFLEESQLGKPRGECLRDMLCELNPDVTGHWAQQLGDMSHYDLFIRTTPSKDISTRNMLERYCFDMQKPLITINSQGFYAYFHVQFSKDFPIVETHPEDTAIRDFGILNPWPELAGWAAELTDDLENQSNHKHGHVPWLALMLYYIRKWQVEHKTEDGQPGPFTGSFKQQKELTKMIQSGIRYENGEGGEENFDQARANVMKTVRHPALSSKVKEIFELCDQEPYRHSKDTFWHLARAVKAFHNKNQRLPLAGSIPDMKAESEVYVQLQKLYKARAKRDIDEVKSYISPTILAKPGMEDEVATFCKNAETLHIVRQRFVGHDTVEEMEALTELARTGKQTEEFEISSADEANVASGAASGERPDLAITPKPPLEYIVIAIRAMETRDVVDMADMEPGVIQGAISDMLTPPADYVQSWAAKEMGQSKLMPGVVREVERARGGELHNTASLVGGLVSQEVIKVVTKQYVPVDNLVVWDGGFCRMATFKL